MYFSIGLFYRSFIFPFSVPFSCSDLFREVCWPELDTAIQQMSYKVVESWKNCSIFLQAIFHSCLWVFLPSSEQHGIFDDVDPSLSLGCLSRNCYLTSCSPFSVKLIICNTSHLTLLDSTCFSKTNSLVYNYHDKL